MYKLYRKKTNIIFMLFITAFIMLFFNGCSNTKGTPSSENTVVPSSKLKVHYINVLHGDSILIQCEDKNMLIDAGTEEQGKTVVDYLQKQKIKKLDYVVLTHSDKDHSGGLSEVLRTFDIGTVYMDKNGYDDKKMKGVLNSLAKKNLDPQIPEPGFRFNLSNASCTVYAPNSKEYKDVNNYSIVIKMVYEKNSFIFMGDALKESEKEMLSKGFDLTADVIKIGHHGSNSATSEELLNKVNPKYAIISLGKEDEGSSHEKTFNRLKEKNIKVYKTDSDGTIVITSDGNSITVYTGA